MKGLQRNPLIISSEKGRGEEKEKAKTQITRENKWKEGKKKGEKESRKASKHESKQEKASKKERPHKN